MKHVEARMTAVNGPAGRLMATVEGDGGIPTLFVHDIAANGAEKFAMYSSCPLVTPAATIDCSVAVVSPPTTEPIVF